MPRDGSNIYHVPPGTEGEPDTTIESAKYNGFLADAEQEANLPRPILAGGTSATSADEALAKLNAEKAGQVITNFDAHTYVAGSFTSAPGSGASPNIAHAFIGIVYIGLDDNTVVVEARDVNDASSPGQLYVRQKIAGLWGPWVKDFDINGGTLTGNLTINKDTPAVVLSKPVSGSFASIIGMTGGTLRWQAHFCNSAAETGGNAGSDFEIARHSDAVPMSTVLCTSRVRPGTHA